MANTKSFPMLPGAHWWALRDKFKQSIPGVVTDSYLAVALNMQAKSARANILPYLRDIGLIDSEGKTQDLAKEWRDDKLYPDVCKKMLNKVYPEELLTAVADPVENRQAAERWFATSTGMGRSAVTRMTQFYIILAEADASKRPEIRTQKPKTNKKDATAKRTTLKKPSATETPSQVAPPQTGVRAPLGPPGVSINLEIHISADSTPDQIDKIFESMAKHIYKKLWRHLLVGLYNYLILNHFLSKKLS
jgi:hypothetical protein